MKQILLLLLSVILCAILDVGNTTAATYGGGSGTSDDPYKISTIAHLRILSLTKGDWSKHFILINDINAINTENYTDGKGWSPIGNDDNKFTGSFDGNGYFIDSLYLNRPGQTDCGLFGTISNATIKNLGVTNCDMAFGSSSGALVGSAFNSSSISNCYAKGIVNGTGYNLQGALVGYLNNSYVDKCYTNCTVTGDMNTGGLIGIIDDESTVTNCFVLGSTSGYKYHGGITGDLASGTVENCYVTGVVSNNSSHIGAVIGYYDEGTISNCYYDITVNPSIPAVDDGANTNVKSLNTSAFAFASNFSSWDFTSIWKVLALASVDSIKRPYLQWAYDHVVTFELGANGNSFVGADIQGVDDGADATAIKTFGADGYIFKEWQNSKGSMISTDNPLTVTNVTQDSTIYATFEAGYKVEFSTDVNGSINGSTYQEITSGNSSSEVEALANEHYIFDEWRNASGDSITNINPLKITYVSQDSALIAVFEGVKHNISFSADANGTIVSGTSQSVGYGSDAASVTATAITGGYGFVEWQDENGNTLSTDNPITLTNITQDSTLIAIFAEKYEDGIGSTDNPYQVATLEQLKNLSESEGDWTRSFILTTDIDATETENWNSKKGFSGIGTTSVKFTGVFDGNSYFISNLYIKRSTNFTGLFGYINGATIKNLGLLNCILTTSNYAGGIAGGAINSTIENCYVFGTLTASNGNVGGGLVGLLSASIIKQCYSNCTVTGNMNTGGLVGIVDASSTVTNCFVTGTTKGSTNRGGIAGQHKSGTISKCYVAGEVVNNSSSSTGAVVGLRTGSLAKCYYDITVNPSIGAVNGGASANVTSLSTSAFADESKFSGWDFSSTWKVLALASIDSIKRPYLQWAYDHIVSFELGTNGDSFVGADIQGIRDGADATAIKAFGVDGYIFKEWQDSKGNKVSTENPLTVTNVTQDSTLYAVFQTGYKVNFYSENNGTISSGDAYQEVTSGNDALPVTAKGNAGYIFDEWRNASGDSITNDNPLIINKVTKDTSLYAIYQAGYKIQFSADENGEVIGTTYQELTPGTTASSVSANANTGYHFDEWRNSAGDSITNDNPLIISKATQDSTLIAVFEIDTYSVIFETNGNGTIKENAEQTVEHGSSSTEVEAIANDGYQFVKWQDENGNEVSTDNPFTLTNVTQDSTITAVFEIKQYTVKFETDGNGTIKANAEQTVEHGSSSTEVEAIANDGYQFVKWQDENGNEISTNNPFTLTNVTRDSTIIAVFEIKQYTVKFETDGNGRIKANAEQTVEYGSSSIEVEAIANDGYQFVKWQDENGNEISTNNPFTLSNIIQDSTITAVFERTTGIESFSTISNLDIYPNPTTGTVIINIESLTGKAKLSIYNVTGEVVYNNPSFNGGTVDLSGLKQGMYIVKVEVDDIISMNRLIKN